MSTESEGQTPPVSESESRADLFKKLKARQADARKANLKATAIEKERKETDPSLLSAVSRKRAIASHKLLKAETEEGGEDFERKRAWDWTVEDSEKWDRRLEKKAKHKEDTLFQDYRQNARKVYKRQMRNIQPDMEEYEKEKNDLIEKAAAQGRLDIVETDEGELVAIDRDGIFFSTADSTDFVENKPSKANVDRLVNDIKKAEEVRLKNRRDRLKEQGDDGGDVTYINAKNKQFNDKLKRFYDKYTSDIRENFERGTAM
ncbi:SYF2-domain-containing protein [Rhizodiscina lignyota]|uniref:Pre-mRNA-splicing factor SYF2 n=1 Tax=Rhizodiscina lignyota TaxID=1504668 RepID=A0A9P4MGJ0_9PEZI|nr:SYF2-domain-containing protein [Rhizodiscina lignyota]